MKIKIAISSLIILISLALSLSNNRERQITIYMIGDSTMADKPLEKENQERGWGQMLPQFFTEDIIVDNHAMNGRSSLSFISEGRWDKVLSLLKEGDYVFIQFGHNDEKTEANLHTVPGESFDENLRRFVRETQAKGAYPVLFNSIVRRNYPPPGQTENQYTYETEGATLVDTHGEYAVAPERVAKEINVPFVNMTRLTHELVEKMGPEESKKLFMWIPPDTYDAHPNGKTDNTHLNIYGGKVIAGIAIQEVSKIIPELAIHLRHYSPEIYVAKYRDDKKCAVSYTFDDGLEEHYTLVYPEMEKNGFKATFFVCGKIIEEKESQLGKPRMTWTQMKEMSDQGHEISNHSWSHPNLTQYSEAEIREEIEKNDSIIEANIGKKPLTFCYPGNYFNEEVIRIASKGRVGTRTYQTGVGGEKSESTVESLSKWIEDLITSEEWGVAMIHGITYGYDAFADPQILSQHFYQMKNRENEIWVDTFERIATYVKARENTQLDIIRNKSIIEILPQLNLDAKLFSKPLTMVIVKDGNNSKIKVSQNKQMLPVKEFEDRYLFDFDPFGGKIEIEY